MSACWLYREGECVRFEALTNCHRYIVFSVAALYRARATGFPVRWRVGRRYCSTRRPYRPLLVGDAVAAQNLDEGEENDLDVEGQ